MDTFKVLFKDLILGVFSPTSVVLILLIIGVILLYRNKLKESKISLVMCLIVFTICSTNPIVDYFLSSIETVYPSLDITSLSQEEKAKVKYVVVLAGGYDTGADLSLSAELAPFTLTRLVEGIVLHKELPGSKLIVTGKGWAKKTEAFAMSEMAIKLGVLSSNIILDEESKNTFEHTQNLKTYLKDITFVLVTSAIHMPRAMGLFFKAGMNPIAAPTDHLLKRKYSFFRAGVLTPHGSNLSDSDVFFSEFLGRLWGKLTGRI
jgi:uncharacterized SAM-binding protein YcdF (DUF218 family)